MTDNTMEMKTNPLSTTPQRDDPEWKECNGNNMKTVNLASLGRMPIFPVCMGRIMSNVYRLRVVSTESCNLRKIEPKPNNVEVKTSQQSEVAKKKKKTKKEKAARILGSNATKRGVRLCLTCKGQIGYRSKKCKHCLNALNKERSEDVVAIQPIIDESNADEKENIINEELSEDYTDSIITCNDDETENDTSDHDDQLIKENNDNEDILQNTGNESYYGDVEGTTKVHNENVCHNMVNKDELVVEDDDDGVIPVEEKVEEVTSVNVGCKRKQLPEENEGKKPRTFPSFILQFVRIEPKPCFKKTPKEDEEEANDKQKTESKRFLSSNATRRGIMSCPLCQKDVGCRSKYCKYCKVAIHHRNERALDYNNLLIVQLSPLTLPDYDVFSVKKTTTPSEDRCFIKQKTHQEGMSTNMNNEEWCCDCDHDESTACLHGMFFVRNPKIIQARTAMLTEQAIEHLPIDDSFKDKLKILWEKNQTNELPLVQQVALNTLVVMEPETTSQCKEEEFDTLNETSCVHIRFEKVIRHSLVQPHIFCSGKSCSFWSMSVANRKDCPITCYHYCISLWAIASDNKLDEYFKIFLDAPQVYLHSEVFETVGNS